MSQIGTAGFICAVLWLVLGWTQNVGALTVEAPKLTWANFTIEADSIQVDFDRSTLQGAVPMDSNGDTLLDSVNFSAQLKGEFDCSSVLADATVVLLSGPPAATCAWTNASRLRVHLAKGHQVQVGDRLMLRESTIYSLPQGAAWSTMGATGNIRISGPSPLEPPVVVITGSTTIDYYAPAQVHGRDSYQVGGSSTYLWALADSTEEAPNPSDLCGNKSRVFDNSTVKRMKDRLSLLSDMHSPVLEVTADLVDPASAWRVILNVTGRWGLTGSSMVELRRLGRCQTITSTTTSLSTSDTVLVISNDDVDDTMALADNSPQRVQLPLVLTVLFITLIVFLNT